MKAGLFIAIASCCAPFALLAEAHVSIDLRHYLIEGADAATIRRQIYDKGPLGKASKRYHAYTEWNIEWSYRWIESNGKCRIQQADVDARIDMLLPQLAAGKRSDELQTAWQQYYDALLRHEQQHRDFGIDAAREIDLELNAIEGWYLCDRLEQVVNQRADAVVQRYADEERRFDRRTGHGAKEGVVLPGR